jgi:hypothetical protein
MTRSFPAGKRFAAAAEIALRTRPRAIAQGDAVLVGDRSGLVEWAGDAWTNLTGFPLTETLDKPISHFLARAELESEMIDLVAHHFLEGRTCRLALPFRSFDGRQLSVHLEVAPLRDASGEVERFVAVASELPSAHAARPEGAQVFESDPYAEGAKHAGPAPLSDGVYSFETVLRSEAAPRDDAQTYERLDLVASPTRTMRGSECSLRAVTSDALMRAKGILARVEHLEARLGDGTLRAAAEPERLGQALDHLIQAATCDATSNPLFITALAGLLPAGRSHHSEVHAIPVRSLASRLRCSVYLELHDTQPHLTRAALERLRTGLPSRTAREEHLRRALALVRELGASLHLDSTPGCGNQSLLVLEEPEP